MATRDIFQMIDSLDKEGVKRVVDRLEYRGKDEIFVAMREAYVVSAEKTWAETGYSLKSNPTAALIS